MAVRFIVIVLAALSIWTAASAAEPNDHPVLLAQANSNYETAKKLVEISNSKQDMSNSPGRIAAKEGLVNAFLLFVAFFFIYHGYIYFKNRAPNSGNGGDATSPTTPKHKLVKIPGGDFEMGSDLFRNSKPVRQVTVSSFMLSNMVVTQEQWSS